MTEGCCDRYYDNMACDCNKTGGIMERAGVLPTSTQYKDLRIRPQIFTLKDIKRFCLQYDKFYHDYPESKYEGRSLYSFIDQHLGTNTYSEEEDYTSEVWEKEMNDVGS